MPDLLISVVVPLTDTRGDGVAHVRSWTHDQTLDRDRYQVVVVSTGDDPALERDVRLLLAPHDAIVCARGEFDAALWPAGVSRADAEWLVITEGHSQADPGALEAARRWIESGASDAANFTTRHPGSSRLDHLSTRWFDFIQAAWAEPGEWGRLHQAGFVIRRSAYDAAGGYDAAYGLFATPLLAARLADTGTMVGRVRDGSVWHVDSETIGDHHRDTAAYVLGELDARSALPATFMERYFGFRPSYGARLRERRDVARTMRRAACSAIVNRRVAPRDLPWMARWFARQLPLTAGPGLRMRIARLSVAWSEFSVIHLPGPRWRRFLRAHRRVVRWAELDWLRRNLRVHQPMRPAARFHVLDLGPDDVVGVHGLERHGDQWFRWSQPVAMLRFSLPEAANTLRIETAGLRGSPLGYVTAVCCGGRVLPRSLVSDAGGDLVVRLPGEWSRRARREGLVLLARPLVPSRHGSSDRRRLGVPIFSLTVEAAAEYSGAVPASAEA